MDNVLGTMSGVEVSPSFSSGSMSTVHVHVHVHVHNVSVNFLIGCSS